MNMHQKPLGRTKPNEHEITNKVATRLRAVRNAKHMTINDLALAVGISYQQIQKYETSKDRISVPRLISICAVLDISMVHFLDPSIDLTLSKYQNLAIDNIGAEAGGAELCQIYMNLSTESRHSLLTVARAIKPAGV